MGMTLTEKILAAHAGKKAVAPGEFIEASVDFCMGNDITAPIAIQTLEKYGLEPWDREKIALVPSHYAPAKDIKSAQMVDVMRQWARKKNIKYFFEIGASGVEHILLPQKGLVVPGEVMIGADSHSCTYGGLGLFSTGVGSTDLAAVMATGTIWLKVPESIRFVYTGKPSGWVTSKDMILQAIGIISVEGANYMAMEHTGEAIRHLSVDARLTLCNMAIEAGGKNGIVEADDVTMEYVNKRSTKKAVLHRADPDAKYSRTVEVDVARMEPLVACHPSPDNVRKVRDLKGLRMDQVFIGSCTNARIEDLRIAAKIMKGRKVNGNLRCIVIPPTPETYTDALKEGLIEIFMEAGCTVNTSTCGPCLGGHTGVLGDGERCLSTSNRNFIGRMGSVRSEVYLTSPAVAAASAITGGVTHPDDLVGTYEQVMAGAR
jgi:3-isopropylmalate/(R)-2-methylmalate dehydratase large subunit